MIERKSTRKNSKKSMSAEKTILSSRLTFYKPTTLSSDIPVIVFKDTTVVEFDKLKACIISRSSNLMFLMMADHKYYICPVHNTFSRLLEQYSFVTLAGSDIYNGNPSKKSQIAEVPVYLD